MTNKIGSIEINKWRLLKHYEQKINDANKSLQLLKLQIQNEQNDRNNESKIEEIKYKLARATQNS